LKNLYKIDLINIVNSLLEIQKSELNLKYLLNIQLCSQFCSKIAGHSLRYHTRICLLVTFATRTIRQKQNSHARAWKALHPRPNVRSFGCIVRMQRRASRWKRTAYIHRQCWFFTTHGQMQNEKRRRYKKR